MLLFFDSNNWTINVTELSNNFKIVWNNERFEVDYLFQKLGNEFEMN